MAGLRSEIVPMVQPRGILIVRSPLHGEIKITLQQTLVVGRSITSDIVMADASIASSHMKLDLDEFPIIRLKALDAGVVFGRDEHLAAGNTRVLSESIDFYAGEVVFSLKLQGLVDQPSSVVTRHRMLPVMLMAVVLGSAVFSTTEGSPLSAQETRVSVAPASSLHVEVEPPSSEPPILLRAFAELKRLELNGVALDLLGDGAMRASGALFEAQASRWGDFKKWLDTQSNGKLVLVDVVTTGNKMPSLEIQSAWLGEAPYVIDGQGGKLFVGASIEDGWIIQGIEPGRISIRRGQQQMAVRF